MPKKEFESAIEFWVKGNKDGEYLSHAILAERYKAIDRHTEKAVMKDLVLGIAISPPLVSSAMAEDTISARSANRLILSSKK